MKKTLPIIFATTAISMCGVNLFSCANPKQEDIELTPVTREKRQMNPNVPNIEVGELRLQILDESTVRLEYKYDNPIFGGGPQWFDDDTMFIPNRTLYKGVKNVTKTTDGINTTIIFGDIKMVIPNSIQAKDEFKGIKIYRDGQEIFTTAEDNLPKDNIGDLPAPEDTGEVFALADYPRIIEPPFGYSAANLYVEPYRSHLSYFEKTCGFEIQEHRDIYLTFPRKDPKALRQQYRNLTGPSELVRLSTLGAWDSRYYPYNETTAQEEVDNYYKWNLPLDNLVIDTDWRAGFDGKGYFVNETLFPNMPRFLKSMKDQNIEVCFNDHPEPQKDEKSRELNVLNQQEVEFRRTNLKKILDMGLDTWWYDRNWSTSLICPEIGDPDKRESMLNHETWGDYLYNNVTRQTHMARASKQYEEYGQYVYKRPIAMSNVVQIHNGNWEGFTDSMAHRYSIQWTGDQNYRMLVSEIANVIKTGINSMPYMSSDLAGHNEGVASDYYYQRWIEYGALSPIFRIHCTRDLPLHCQPWLRGEKVTEVFRNWINLRYRLLPLYYSLAHESYENGMPICRALGFEYPNDSNVNGMLDEYMIGKNILFAPCTLMDEAPSEDFKGNWNSTLKATFFENEDFTGMKVENIPYTKLEEQNMKQKGIEVLGKGEHFSVRFEGTFTPSETKELVFNSDDGVRVMVKINGEYKTASDWESHGSRDFHTKLVLEKDVAYPMVVEYFQGGNEGSIYTRASDPNFKLESEKKSVYLPEGKWLDLFNGIIYDGGQSTPKINYPVGENALFVRLGSMTPVIANAMNTKELDWTRLSYDVYPTTSTAVDNGTLYEDDFETVAYQNGFYHKSNYHCYYDNTTNQFVIHLDPSEGWFIGDDKIANRQYIIRIHKIPGLNYGNTITVDGETFNMPAPLTVDPNAMPFGFGNDASRDEVIEISLDLHSVRLEHEIRFDLN